MTKKVLICHWNHKLSSHPPPQHWNHKVLIDSLFRVGLVHLIPIPFFNQANKLLHSDSSIRILIAVPLIYFWCNIFFNEYIYSNYALTWGGEENGLHVAHFESFFEVLLKK